MPLTTGIIHPRLFQQLETTYWRHTLTVQTRPKTLNEVGGVEKDETLNPWTAYTGHENISCNIGRRSDSLGEKLTEILTPNATYDETREIAMLNGYWPLIGLDPDTTEWRAIVEGTSVQLIRGVVHNSNKSHTELVLVKIT